MPATVSPLQALQKRMAGVVRPGVRRSSVVSSVRPRIGTGMGAGLGLLLGPFGIPLAGVADMSQNDKRELINKEIQRRCVTPR